MEVDTEQLTPQPDPALKRLDPLVGKWTMKGHMVGSDEENIVGEASYEWMPGGFFLRQHVKLDFAGFAQIDSTEMIGYDPETKTFASQVYSNMSPVPLPYNWDFRDNKLTIKVSYGPMDATFEGELSEDGNSMSGGWRPNPGADETVNVPYDISGTRIQ
jgi:hypothetical protein